MPAQLVRLVSAGIVSVTHVNRGVDHRSVSLFRRDESAAGFGEEAPTSAGIDAASAQHAAAADGRTFGGCLLGGRRPGLSLMRRPAGERGKVLVGRS